MSGFTSFLKKFGMDVAKGARFLLSTAPSVVINEVRAVAEQISDIKTLIEMVKTGEGMFAAAGLEKAGSQKLAAITPYVSTLMQDVEIIAGKKIGSMIKDQANFNGGVQDLITALVRILNACGE